VVTPLDPPKRAGIIALRIPDPIDVGRALQAEGVVCVVREGLLRLSPHFYNTLEEIEQVVEVLEGLLSG
jgi:kynureninase